MLAATGVSVPSTLTLNGRMAVSSFSAGAVSSARLTDRLAPGDSSTNAGRPRLDIRADVISGDADRTDLAALFPTGWGDVLTATLTQPEK